MSENLNKEQQEMVSGGNSYCKFPDGKVLVCYTGVHSHWEIYNNWDQALADSKKFDPHGIGTFTPRKSTDRLFISKRQELESSHH